MIPLPEPDAYGPSADYSERTAPFYKAETVAELIAAARRQALEEAARVCDERRDLYEATGHPREFIAARACGNTIRSLIDKDTATSDAPGL